MLNKIFDKQFTICNVFAGTRTNLIKLFLLPWIRTIHIHVCLLPLHVCLFPLLLLFCLFFCLFLWLSYYYDFVSSIFVSLYLHLFMLLSLTFWYIYIYIYIYMQSWKQCDLLVITTVALWQLMHLGNSCTMTLWQLIHLYQLKLDYLTFPAILKVSMKHLNI